MLKKGSHVEKLSVRLNRKRSLHPGTGRGLRDVGFGHDFEMRISAKIMAILSRFHVCDATRRVGATCLKPRLEIRSVLETRGWPSSPGYLPAFTDCSAAPFDGTAESIPKHGPWDCRKAHP